MNEKKQKKLSTNVEKVPFGGFSHFVWIFFFYPFLAKMQREALDRKFLVAIRIAHRCPFISASDLFTVTTREKSLEIYVQRYIKKRWENIYKSDLRRSLFLGDIFYCDEFRKMKKVSIGHFFRLNRSKKLINRHKTLLIKRINFVQQ